MLSILTFNQNCSNYFLSNSRAVVTGRQWNMGLFSQLRSQSKLILKLSFTKKIVSDLAYKMKFCSSRDQVFSGPIAGLSVSKLRFFLLVLFERFFFLLTYAEITEFNWLKALFSAGVGKKKEPVKRTAILRHVNRLQKIFIV